MSDQLPSRQIHLDFHTSEKIAGIGADFDADAFADTLAKAHVNSVNLFALCHHGWIYYDSRKFAQQKHPHLECNLLKEQIEACHRRGIKTPIYVSVQFAYETVRLHPEWLAREPSGRHLGIYPFDPGFYHVLCLNTPYVDHLKAVVGDIFDSVPVDGFWFDIVVPRPCCCRYCTEGMLAEGMDPREEDDRIRYGNEVLARFQNDMTAHVRSHDEDVLIFYNSGHIGPKHRAMLPAFTHLELESLPSGHWGYIHYPLTARYARTLGYEHLGMTGKFHTAWGDFHSYKNEEALDFEVLLMLAMGAKCCIGDQLHPRGTLCPVSYGLIGNVYEKVEALEPWCVGVEPVCDIAVYHPEEFELINRKGGSLGTTLKGAVRLLQELHYQFDIVDSQADISRYKLVVLPDEIPVDDALAKKLNDFVAAGGKILATHRGGLETGTEAFAVDLGATYEGEAEFAPVFVVPTDEMGATLPKVEHALYLQGSRVAASGGTVLAANRRPYFNRTWEHYCSHRHAPGNGETCGPAAVATAHSVYFAQPLFTQYADNAPRWVRTLVGDALARLLPDPVMTVDGPHALIATVNRQAEPDRYVVHLLCYLPMRTSDKIDIVDEVIPIHDVAVTLRVGKPVSSVSLAPSGEALDFTRDGDAVRFVLPRLDGHAVVALA